MVSSFGPSIRSKTCDLATGLTFGMDRIRDYGLDKNCAWESRIGVKFVGNPLVRVQFINNYIQLASSRDNGQG